MVTDLFLWLQMMDGTPTDERSASTMSQASSPVEARGEFPNFFNSSIRLDHVLINAKCVDNNFGFK